MYADDLVIMAPSVAGLSKLLRICELFGASHDMIFNQKKSASVYLISKTLKGAHLPNVYLNGEEILQVVSVKYLGHHLTNNLHDDLDIRRQRRAINVLTALLCILLPCGGTTRKCQLILQAANNLSQHTQN